MFENGLIIKTRKLSVREVKNKLREFIDGISEDCGPEVEEMAEELKAHGDAFVDALSGNGESKGAAYRRVRAWHRNNGGGGMNGGPSYRNEGSWEEREELRKKNEKKLQELDREMQELKARMREDY